MFAAIYNFFGTILSFFNSITGSYAVALILYALVFKIIFLPFSIKTQKNQIAMAKLRPKIAKIEKKYAGRTDRVTMQKKQQEIMELQQQEGYSMLSGCLPLLLQFPIIIFLYNVIRRPLSYIAKWSADVINAANTALLGDGALDEIKLVNALNGADASVREGLGISAEMMGKVPNFNLFGVNLADTPSLKNISILVLIPVFAAAFQWLSMFLMKKWQGNVQPGAGTDAQSQMSMRMMDLVFPLLTLWMAFSFSGMLGLYWIYQSIFATLQQFILSKVMPLPKFSAEDLKEMEKAERTAAAERKAALAEKPKVKSLHYIDEDDYDELPEVKKNTPENKNSVGLSSAELKDDRKH